MLVATAGATLGGAVTWWMGYGAERAYEHVTHKHPRRPRAALAASATAPKACLLSWLPVVGDPLCAVAGWLKLPFWPCLVYMAIGKFGRYLVMTAALLWVVPGPAHALTRTDRGRPIGHRRTDAEACRVLLRP